MRVSSDRILLCVLQKETTFLLKFSSLAWLSVTVGLGYTMMVQQVSVSSVASWSDDW